ncbi:glycosyltransferase family 2 protein [Streptomyces xiaopingdaonensis]|uniref:glycosyltransferase family 2 protein n=1 Tax=Streptomyces xiaopingdaonensis TaxID=1565415 RepID=UPI000319DCB7|nr:glycosyltransferase [Streptomyces xiaopingdaonensis]
MTVPTRGAPPGGVPRRAAGPPDVSVVVAVHDTMPYLTTCLRSLAEQTLGEGRLEVIVVDDGSTDGSGDEIAAWAGKRPELFRTERLPQNSGGPALPSNLGLERARGRYVFFLGADDHLVPEALERMVAAADAHGSDVLLCKMAAVGERKVPSGVFARSAPAIRLVGDGLPWALSNTKLFRRELLERHGLRYEEGMPAFSDQPFVLAACVGARRISVLADRVYYHAVRRADSGNITYRTGPEVRLRCAERLLDATHALLEGDEELRRGFHRRHFHVELHQLFRDGFLALEPPAQRAVCRGAGALVERYGDGVLERLDPERRTVLELAREEQLEALRGVLRWRKAVAAGEWGRPEEAPVVDVRRSRVRRGVPARVRRVAKGWVRARGWVLRGRLLVPVGRFGRAAARFRAGRPR